MSDTTTGGTLTRLPRDDQGGIQPLPAARPPAVRHPLAGTVGKLAGALSACRDKCKAAHKDAVNSFHKYEYASAEEILRVAGDALEGSGLSVLPVRAELTVLGAGATAVHALNRELLLVHASGEAVPLEVLGWPVIPDRGRPLDKAFASALTTSLAYLMRDLLQMPRVDPADDLGGREDRPQKPPAPKPEPVPAAAKATKPAPPTTGAELLAKVRAADDELFAKGYAGSGDLYRHVVTWGSGEVPPCPVNVEEWSPAEVAKAYAVAAQFIRAKSAKK